VSGNNVSGARSGWAKRRAKTEYPFEVCCHISWANTSSLLQFRTRTREEADQITKAVLGSLVEPRSVSVQMYGP
jgi:hypothetical protein